MVTTKHKRRSLVPLSLPNLPTSQPHLILLVFSPSRLGNHCNEPQKGHLSSSPNLQISEHQTKKTPNVSFQKAVLFKMRQRNIFLTKRQNSMVVSACELNLDWLSSELAKTPANSPPTQRKEPSEVMFFFPTETFPGVFVVGQEASNGK